MTGLQLKSGTYFTGLVEQLCIICTIRRARHQPLQVFKDIVEEVEAHTAAPGRSFDLTVLSASQSLHGGVKEVFPPPPLKSYSPCHLPLVIIKENIIIVSTFGAVSVQRRSVSS